MSGRTSFTCRLWRAAAFATTATALIAGSVVLAPRTGAEATLQVPEAFPTIQAAVDAASPGDVIDVGPGAYEGVVLNKSVTLRARVYDATDPRNNTTLIDGGQTSAVVVPFGVSPAPTVIGFELRTNVGDAVLMMSPVVIEDNHITAGDDLLAFEKGAGGIVRGNVLEGAGDDGIDVDHLIKSLLIEGNRVGPSGQDGIEVRLQGNTIPQTAVLTIRANEIFDSGQDAIQLVGYNTVTNRRLVIERNLLRNNGKAGIGLMDLQETNEDFRAAGIPERIHVFHNTFVDNDHGISGGDNLVAVNNVFKGHVLGLKGVDGNSTAAYTQFHANISDFETSNVDLATTYSGDPLLDGPYDLTSGSPAIDAGTATFTFQGEHVLDQAPSDYNGPAPDLGWRESAPSGPPQPALFVGDTTAPEGDPPATTTFNFPVTVANPPDIGTVTVDYTTEDASATASTDYTAAGGTLTFTFPGPASQNVDVLVSADTDSEATETFHVRLADGTGAAISDNVGTGRITNDDAPPPTVSAGDVSAPEGDPPATTTFSFPVTVADPPASGSLTVTYGIEGDTAAPGTDYATGGGVLTFDFPGPTTMIADVSISADTEPEPDETFQLVLTGVTGVDGATITDNAGQGTITNDDIPPPPTVVDVRVATGNDDAEESASGSVGLTSSDLELVLDGNNQTIGMRFAAVAVPRNAQITNAYVQLTVDATSSAATALTIAGEASGNAAAFAKTARNLSARPRTDPSAAVRWAPVPWTTRGQAGPGQRTPNLAAVVQQIVDRSDWTSGNALALIVTGSGKRTAVAYNANASAAPLLHIEYLPPGRPQNHAPVVSAGPDRTVALAAGASLDGTLTDDGLPGPAPDTAWSQVNGPPGGIAEFADAAAVDTTVSFNLEGVYVLRFEADDGLLSGSDEVTVTVNAFVPPPPPTVVDVRVATGNDDAEESASGSVGLTSSDLELVLDGNNQTIGMRFAAVAVPRNAQITNAYVQLTVDATSSAATALTIAGEASGNAAAFAKTARNLSARPRTDPSAAVRWAPVPWTTRGQAGPGQRTPNLAAVVQQIVDRSDWTSGNALALIVTGSGKRTAVAYNANASAAPLLHIEYVVG